MSLTRLWAFLGGLSRFSLASEFAFLYSKGIALKIKVNSLQNLLLHFTMCRSAGAEIRYAGGALHPPTNNRIISHFTLKIPVLSREP